MFYFYAMLFLLADDGIVYNEANSLDMGGITYPGIKIGYEANIGDTPDDTHILYYHPEAKKMEWLAYAVTYGKDGTSSQYSFVKYNKWQEVNGLLIPEEITWCKIKNNKPIESAGKARIFTKVDRDAANMDKMTFSKPESGVYVE